ncbi:MAG: beta-ketoacyl-[acyl-carrier-protein] synthase family protein [Enhygromyxa sp.]
MSGSRRVVVTGAGVATALGLEVEELWRGLLDGRCGIGLIEQFPAAEFDTRIGGEVDIAQVLARLELGPHPELDAKVRINRTLAFALWASARAWTDSGLDRLPPQALRRGVCVGAGVFPALEQRLAGRELNADPIEQARTLRRTYADRPELLTQLDPGEVSTCVATQLGCAGPVLSVQAACTSGSQAIGHALELVRYGEADVVITGGADSMMSALSIVGFELLGALSKQPDPAVASRPFDSQRDGFVIAEGAGILVLESLDHARARGARAYAELVGYGSSGDGWRFTDLHPEGEGARRSMLAALSDAGIAPAQVGYLNAHGTSTLLNDLVESAAIREIFGERVPVSSTKSQLGHLICAAGAIEAIVCALALRDQILPPTINLDHPDPSCALDHVRGGPRALALDHALSNSFGFGGQNASLIFTKAPAELARGGAS